MASVTQRRTSSDYDEARTAEQQLVHYMYCDNCGSFAITDWLDPPDFDQLLKLKSWANQVRNSALIATLVTAVLAILGLPILLFLSLLILVTAATLSSYIARRIHLRGAICQECRITYVNGSTFFTEPEKNPRNYTMGDVPQPLEKVYQIKTGS